MLQSRVSKLNEQLETEKLGLLAVVERKNQEIANLNGKCVDYSVYMRMENSLTRESEGY